MLIIKGQDVLYNEKKIAKISKDGKILYTFRDYKRHLLRKLNAFGLNSQAYATIEPKLIRIFINKDKYFLITKEKYDKFMTRFRTLVKFKGYERQLMIPLAIMDLHRKNENIRKGVSANKFVELVSDPHSLYGNWKGRLK